MEWIRKGASINCVCNGCRSKSTLLYWAARYGYTHMAEWLMENGADHTARTNCYFGPNRTGRNTSNKTPAEYSNDCGDGSVARVIEEFVKR